MHAAAVVEAAVDVLQEIRDRGGRAGGVEFHLERAEGRFETHADCLRAGLRPQERQGADRQRDRKRETLAAFT